MAGWLKKILEIIDALYEFGNEGFVDIHPEIKIMEFVTCTNDRFDMGKYGFDVFGKLVGNFGVINLVNYEDKTTILQGEDIERKIGMKISTKWTNKNKFVGIVGFSQNITTFVELVGEIGQRCGVSSFNDPIVVDF
jgi:hypothetical protein